MAKTAVFCTGFGDFLGVKGNPTAAVVDALPAFLEKDLPAVQASNPWELKLAETLNVSIQGCKLALAQIEEAVESESRPCVLLHLGVAPRASASLEIQAWNEATFRVPDEKGNHPHEEALSSDCAIGTPFCAAPDCAAICERLQARGHNVAVSMDPGKFICNWIAYNSMRLAARLTSAHTERPVWSLFCHLPPAEVMSTASGLALVKDLVDQLVEALGSTPMPTATDAAATGTDAAASASSSADVAATGAAAAAAAAASVSDTGADVDAADETAVATIVSVMGGGASAEDAKLALQLNDGSMDDALMWLMQAVATGSLEEARLAAELSRTGGRIEGNKLVILVRKDLKMSPGKIAAQCSHAALAAARGMTARDAHTVKTWRMGGEPIVVLGCTNQASMNALFTEATARGLLASPIRDAGRTEVDPGTMTVMAIGPAPASKVDAVTGKLRLL